MLGQDMSLAGPDMFIGTTSDVPGMEYTFPWSVGADIELREGCFSVPSSYQEAIAGYDIALKHGWQVG
jgi:hypothetical protein